MSPSGRVPAVTGVALVAGIAYTLAAAPGIQIWDSAELSAAAYRLGPSHPPGQPLYSLLGKLATLLPFGSIAFRTNLLSAAAAALSVWLAGRIAAAWASRTPEGSSLAGPLAALAVAATGPLVNQATRAEVYAPALALFLLAMLRVTRALLADAADTRPVSALASAGLWSGLAATLHPVAGLSAGLIGLVAVALLRPAWLGQPRVWMGTLGALALGVAPLAFVALRCRGGLEPCWEVDLTPTTFFRYVTGASYRSNLQTGSAALETIVAAGRFAALRSGLVAPAIVLAAGLLAVQRGALRPALVIAAAIGVPFLFLVMQPFHPDNPDTQGYLLPALVLLLVAAPVLAPSLVRGRPTLALGIAVVATLASVGGGDAAASLRPRSYLAGDVAQQALGEPLPKSLIVAGSDAVFFGMQYGLLVECQRPDVALMATGLATQRRQWSDAARRRPEVSLRRARPTGPGDVATRYAQGALALVQGVIPRMVEDPLLDVTRARSTGVLFQLDAPDAPMAPFPTALTRELDRRHATYADGSDSMIRLVRLRRAFDHEAHGELTAAVPELLAGLWEDRPTLEKKLAGFAPQGPPRMRPLTPIGWGAWVTDTRSLRAALARVLYRGARTDLAVAVLERDFRDGEEQAAMVFAEIELREGRIDEAEGLYRAFAEAHPEREGYALVGLALVQAARGDRQAAENMLRRVRPGDDGVLETWARDAREQIVPAMIAPNAPSAAP